MKRWLNVMVKGRSAWPTKETTVEFGGRELVLKPATRTTEQSMHIDLRKSKISDVEALTLINRFLSILSWCDDQAMERGFGWAGTAAPVAITLESRAVGTSIAFPFYRKPEPDRKARLALALFREGRTVNSVPFEFLSYFKILNVFWKDKFVKVEGKRQNPIVEGIRAALPKIKDRLAVRRLSVLAKTEPDVPQYLYDQGRNAIAHAYADPIVDPDDVSDLRRLSEDMHLIKAIAEHLMETELKLSKSIIG